MIRNLFFYIGYFYFLLIIKTCQTKLVGEEKLQEEWKQGIPVVLCCPHNFLLTLFAGTESAPLKRPIVTVVTSLSSDGELISKLLKRFRCEMVRGSSNRGGKKALLELTRAAQAGKSLGIAFDGPKGPPFVPKRGLIGCARATGGSLFLIHGHARASKFLPFLKPFRVNSWDKFLIPVPFCSIEVCFEKIPSQNELTQEENEDFILSYIERRSREVFGGIYQN
jgi:lysophospholipid acyltransferase (LPLAT)-like uncharacterized protein